MLGILNAIGPSTQTTKTSVATPTKATRVTTTTTTPGIVSVPTTPVAPQQLTVVRTISSVVQEAPLPTQQKWATASSGGPSAAQIVAGVAGSAEEVQSEKLKAASAVRLKGKGKSLSPSSKQTAKSTPSSPIKTSTATVAASVAVAGTITPSSISPQTAAVPPGQVSNPALKSQSQVQAPTQATTTLPASATTANEAMDNRLPPSLADLVASFEITKERSIKRGEDHLVSSLLDASALSLPDTLDSERYVLARRLSLIFPTCYPGMINN